MALEIVAVDSLQAIDAQQWDDLWSSCPDATVFQTRQWLQSISDTVVESGQQIKAVLVFEDGRLVGMAPLVRAKSDDARAGDAQWLILGDDYSDYQLFLARGGSPRIVDALIRGIDAVLPRGDALALHDVPQFSSFGLYLAQGAVRGRWFVHGAPGPCPTLRVQHNAAGVARILSKSSLRRSERSLARLGKVSVEHLRSAAAIKPVLDGLFEQHIQRWAAAGMPSLFANAKNRDFYHRLTDTLGAVGGVHFTIVRLDGRPVAQHYGLQSRRSFLWYKPAFDVSLSAHSPGDVLLKSLVQYAADQQFEELDFTRGDESFKSRFASVVGFNRSYVWYRRAAPRWKAKLKHFSRGVRDRIRPPTPPTEPPLGGASGRADLKRVLLVNPPPTLDRSWRELVQGVEICTASSSSLTSHAADAPRTLVVACDEVAARDILSLAADHPLRRAAVLADERVVTAALNGALAEFQPRDRVTVNAGFAADTVVCCLYAHGCMIAHFVMSDSLDDRSVAAVRHAKAALDSAGWHGLATVRFAAGDNQQIEIAAIEPWMNGCLAEAARANVNFPRALLRLASGLRATPQPLPTRS